MSELLMTPELVQLADECGVATQYWGQSGERVVIAAETVHAVLASLGYDTSSVSAINTSLEQVRTRDWRRMLPAFTVGVQGQERRLWVHVTHGDPASVWVEAEDGFRTDLAQMDYWVEPVEIDGVLIGEASFAIPADLPVGYYTIHASSQDRTLTAQMAMTPVRLHPEVIAGERQWGFMEQLYATRSRNSWGLGDLHDCADVATWSAKDFGAGFLLINPLHAAAPTKPMAPSPYLPVSRRFSNPIYLCIEDLPEYAESGKKVRKRIEKLAKPLRAMNASADLLDRDTVWAAKREALEVLFAEGLTKKRAQEFADYCQREGQGLVNFAIWSTLCDGYGSDGSAWPQEYHEVTNPAIALFAATQSTDVQFHMWMQFVVDEQLARTQAAAKSAGMAIGIMLDLAVGVHPEGSDAWSLRNVLAQNIGVGAPPDMYNQLGQNWHQPPWHPIALAEAGYLPYREIMRAMMRNAGGLRIDHVLGLFRMWWVPSGMQANMGTFVRFDFEAMIGLLVLEAHRAGVLVIGEDLGTVEPWVQDVLRERGILGTSVLWFESGDDGFALAPEHWRKEVLASVTVHDLPPTAGFLRDEHVRIRHELGLLTRSEDAERAVAKSERDAWVNILRDRQWLRQENQAISEVELDEVALALHRALGASPARLVGISLPDVIGDRRAQNQPGTDQEYPNWRVPMTNAQGEVTLIEDMQAKSAQAQAFVNALSTQ